MIILIHLYCYFIETILLHEYCTHMYSWLLIIIFLKGGMHIFLKSLTGRLITVEVDANDTIEIVKSKIDDKLNIPIDNQRLIYGTIQLEDSKRTVDDYGIEPDSVVFLVISFPG